MSKTRYILLLMMLMATPVLSQAQLYGNEWIDYNATYYKFKAGKEGIYRISKTTLDNAGVPTATPGTRFKMFHEGVEVPLLVSTNGAFGANDYIEFFGELASGRPDTLLYDNLSWQPDINRSLFTDTGVYFLTVNNAANNLRYANVPNVINNPPAAEPFCWATAEAHYKDVFFGGKRINVNYSIFFSTFDEGEGFAEGSRATNQPFSVSLNTPNVVSGRSANVKLVLLRNTYNVTAENLTIQLNNQPVTNSTIAADATTHINQAFSSSLLSGNNTLQFTSAITGGSNFDFWGCSYVKIQYPRNLDVSGLDYFKFALPAAGFQYLELQNFNHGGTPPVLYDLTNKSWYAGDITVSGLTRFYLQPSSLERTLILVSTNSSSRSIIQPAKSFQFINYANAANQGNYVIVTHPNYNRSVNGRKYVDDYKNYRTSASGGNHNVVIAYVDDLYDQFAYGVETHAMAVKNFIRKGYDSWAPKPENLFLIGKGISYDYNNAYRTAPQSYDYDGIVPSYGYPGADVDYVNFLPNKLQAINIGRLSAWSAAEVGKYLDKIKAYESALSIPTLPDYQSETWKKKALHAAGGKTVGESAGFLQMLSSNGVIIRDTAFGARISNVSKTSTSAIDETVNLQLDTIINGGVSLITYHGHGSSTNIELNSLNYPDNYNCSPRFSNFLALGCDIAQIFTLSKIKSISERYLYSDKGGSVSIIAANNLQYPDFHQRYLPAYYTSISKVNYGRSVSSHYRYAYNQLRTASPSDTREFVHLESMVFQGDPALHVFSPSKPDYHVSASQIAALPANVTTALDSFSLKIVAYNLAKAITDSVSLKIEHLNPANITTTLAISRLVNLYNTDTIILKIPINKTSDLGLNRYKVTIDHLDKFEETNENNNTATLDLFIYSESLVPVYPKEFAIVNQQAVTLKASTLNPFRGQGNYRMEIDTTELFNSTLKQQITISSPGGVIKWTPTISYKDSTVYYWRAAFDSAINGEYRWAYSSFLYLPDVGPGWNQSHYYQYLKDGLDQLQYGTDRVFKYPTGNTVVDVNNAIFSFNSTTTDWNSSAFNQVSVNGQVVQELGCEPWGGTLQVIVFDSVSTAMWENNGKNGGGSGSYIKCMPSRNEYAFEFPLYNITGRNDAKHFLDSIPVNNYVLVKNMINDEAYNPVLVNEMKADELVNGAGQSLYHTLFNMGFNLIDSFTSPRPFIFFRKKGNASFPVTQAVANYKDTLIRSFSLPRSVTEGKMNGTVIGPAKEWQTLKWSVSAKDGLPQNDIPSIKITGITKNNTKTLLYTGFAKDTSLSFISAELYPNLELQWSSLDSVNRTSSQLDYWRVHYTPVPEAALNPSAHLVFKDSVQTGQLISFAVAIENLTPLDMDSMLVSYKVIDANNVSHVLQDIRYRPLPGNDTLHASVSFDPMSFPGKNLFFVEANPNNDQPEQYHPNNLGYLPFNVFVDNKNPLIDVTFDGVHILDRDIVSAKPFIKIALRDENKYLKLDDTSLLTLKIKSPSGDEFVTIPFDGNISKFVPAQGNKNEAFIEYKPNLPEDGFYEMAVTGKDKTGNTAGKTEYKISFEVVNKATITNILNYPNPFSTSTAFLFTLTGSQVPTQFKIQVLTVTGKVVREITRQELGNIHVGRNITDYKWDGKDQYGQTLGNGVYFYRVVTSLNGSQIEHNSSAADKFYKNGYGKMYIMR
ncbi:MAG TPA: C25 family cysteine peptidase [Flavipsychrobacter sp.]|nr:C25 family cysteine peptidase [Flavipsychrobacter sp.]